MIFKCFVQNSTNSVQIFKCFLLLSDVYSSFKLGIVFQTIFQIQDDLLYQCYVPQSAADRGSFSLTSKSGIFHYITLHYKGFIKLLLPEDTKHWENEKGRRKERKKQHTLGKKFMLQQFPEGFNAGGLTNSRRQSIPHFWSSDRERLITS